LSSSFQSSLTEALNSHASAIAYELSRFVARQFAGHFVLETTSSYHEIEAFAAAGGCTFRSDPQMHTMREAQLGRKNTVEYLQNCGLLSIEYQGHSLWLLEVEWETPSSSEVRSFLSAKTQAIAESFYRDYKAYAAEVRDEILVFDEGYWDRDEELFKTIRGSSLESLILDPALKSQLVQDFERFFRSKELYASMGVPWKRGSILIGPPGNGKTLAIKALANHLRVPVLYVRSFVHRGEPYAGIREVFRRARLVPGCLLVLEDLDALITEQNRSYFLNELDGFAQNEGICLIATTNHPEQLDAAMLERPSRFDRKYNFALPAQREREAFLRDWFSRRPAHTRPTELVLKRVSEECNQWSFAYLKELCMAATMQLVLESDGSQSAIDEAFVSQSKALRAQMSSRKVTGILPPRTQD
jgi:hypothetical protein